MAEVIAAGPGAVRWIAYEDFGQTWSAAYLDGSLIRPNGKGFYVADQHGGRVSVTAGQLADVRRCTPPDTPPVWPPQQDLIRAEDRDHDDTGQLPDVTRRPRSDVGNANRLVATFGDDIRWVPQWGVWLTWDQRRWQPDVRGRVIEMAKVVAQTLFSEAITETDQTERKAAIRWAETSESAPRIEAMVKMARSSAGIHVEPDQLDANPWLLNVINGTVDLRTGQLRAHRRQDLITKMAGTHYDPEAASRAFWAMLERILPDPEVRDYLQRAVGYSLTGRTSEQVLFLLWGAGSNGKTTLLEVLCTLLGDYATTAEADLLMVRGDHHPTGIADLAGARFVVSTEVQDGKRLDEAAVKRLTGSDTVTARRLYHDNFSFTPSHKLWVGANHRPVVRGTDLAIWRRLKLIPFAITISDADKDQNLPDKLRSELPGILTWALTGCVRWQRQGLTEPETVRAATAAYRGAEDTIAAFLADECTIGVRVWVFAADIYSRYKTWATDNGEPVLSQKRFGAVLTDKGFERYQSGKTRWRGVALVTNTEGGTVEPSDPDSENSSYTHTRGDFPQRPLDGSMVPLDSALGLGK